MLEVKDNLVYFRPFLYEFIDIPLVYSHINDLNKCDGLVLDLRGCVGGDFSWGTILSFFIKENMSVLFSRSNIFNCYSSTVARPSEQIFVQAPVVILIDARTTCAPELLINALRKSRSDIHIIGPTNTSGSAQYAWRTALPGNAMLHHFDGVLYDANESVIDDNKGIFPDERVSFDGYKDLFPYEDKLKQLAFKYLLEIRKK